MWEIRWGITSMGVDEVKTSVIITPPFPDSTFDLFAGNRCSNRRECKIYTILLVAASQKDEKKRCVHWREWRKIHKSNST